MTSMTPALAKVQEYRNNMNDGRELTMASNNSCCVYKYLNRQGKPTFIGYKGRSKKPAVHYFYNSIEDRDGEAEKWMNGLIEAANQKKKVTQERNVEVGDIFRSSWGYEQTNIDYYKVIALVGKASVQLVEIGSIRKHDDIDRGKCIPDVNDVIGVPFVKRVNGDYVRINSFSSARKMEPTIIAGAKVYESSCWSSYA